MIEVVKLSREEWKLMAADAHVVCFNERIPKDFNNIDFAVITAENKTPQTYATVRVLDKESCYWQYAGAFPSSKGQGKSLDNMKRTMDYCFAQGFKRISFYVESDNTIMLHMALRNGFKIIGTRTFKGCILVEFLYEQPGS